MLITSGVLRVKLRQSITVNVVIGAAEWKSEGGWVELGRSFPDLIRTSLDFSLLGFCRADCYIVPCSVSNCPTVFSVESLSVL